MRTLASELGPHVDRLSRRPRIYADANIPAGVVGFMRTRLRWDVLFVLEHDDLRRATDGEHYRLARQLHRTLVTLDRDYCDDGRFPPRESGGVIVLSAPDERGLAKLMRRVDRAFFRSRQRRARDDEDRERQALPLIGQKIHAHPGWSGPRHDDANTVPATSSL